MGALPRKVWQAFVGLFGLNACPVPPPQPTPARRQAAARLRGLLTRRPG